MALLLLNHKGRQPVNKLNKPLRQLLTSTPSSIHVEAGAETPAQLTDKESTFTYGAEMDFNSRYVWRGLLLDDGPVGQPSAWISAFGFTLTAWSNVAMTDASG